jgi:acyl-CoA reductase-like NAD-dependent aldehyde dehydrogenase
MPIKLCALQAVPMALRGAFQSSGQNCAGAERFYVHEKVHDAFVDGIVSAAKQMRQGHALAPGVDCGAMCMPTQAAFVHELVADAVSKGARIEVGEYSWGTLSTHMGTLNAQTGARIEVGGVLPDQSTAQFYPPTILTGVTHAMRIAREEVFGPVLAVFKVASDDEAVTLANDCDFGLGSNVFSASVRRAEEIGSRLEAGMTSVNDFCATYMAQSLPFGGVKASGFDKFAGIEGLRGCCRVKAVVVDSWPLIKTKIPAPLRYPVAPYAFGFCKALCYMFFAPGLLQKVSGLIMLAKCFLGSSPRSAAQPTQAPNKKSGPVH